MSAFPSPNFGERRGCGRPPPLRLPYSPVGAFAAARDRLCAPEHEVSAHWLISETGAAEPLVDEAMRAWHAGAGEWAGLSDINSHSIGIELANTGSQPFAEPQMAALERLIAGIMVRWSIPAHRVIAHSDMAPLRKGDPGARFDWRRLALRGLSVWPEAGKAAPESFVAHARAFGYPDAPPETLLAAFRLRFRPWAKGEVDAVDAGLAADLARRFPG